MRLLADENCDRRLIEALRLAGHDVVSVLETFPGADDAAVYELAARENRTLLTEDKGFGKHQRDRMGGSAVILIRIPLSARTWLIRNAAAILGQYERTYAGRFAVITPGRLRIPD